MSTEMTSSDFFRAVKGPLDLIWNTGKFTYKGVKAANEALKKREQINKGNKKNEPIIRNFWIVGSAPVYCNSLGRELYAISVVGDEDTRKEYPQSYLNVASAFRYSEGYQVPCGYYDQIDQYGKKADFIKINELMILDHLGNLKEEVVVDIFFNLYCTVEFAAKNEWL